MENRQATGSEFLSDHSLFRCSLLEFSAFSAPWKFRERTMPKRVASPRLERYVNTDMPAGYAHQARDFVRIHWFEHYLYSIEADGWPGGEDVSFALVEGDALYSHASVAFRTVECNGEIYASGGLSAVLTYPWFRGRGYGRQVVAAANAEIDASAMDVAILWTDEPKIPFYTHLGWEHMPAANTVKGDRAQPEHHEGVVMMRFVSVRGKQAREYFAAQQIHIGKHGW